MAYPDPMNQRVPMSSFLVRLRTYVERGILHGVYAAVVLLIVGMALFWLASDYSMTKARAENGQRAWEVIQRAQQQQKAEAK